MTSFLYCGSIPITSPLEGRPTPALGADMPCFTSVLRVSLFVFFPYFGVSLLPSFSNVFGLIIKITVDGKCHTEPEEIRENLIKHITHGVQWTSMTRNMARDGVNEFYEIGTDDTLQKIVARMCPNSLVTSIWNYGNVKQYKIEY